MKTLLIMSFGASAMLIGITLMSYLAEAFGEGSAEAREEKKKALADDANHYGMRDGSQQSEKPSKPPKE